MNGIVLKWEDLPTELIERHKLERRAYDRGGSEVRFLMRHYPRVLPAWRGSEMILAHWGGRRGVDKGLPPSPWTWRESVESGKWSAVEIERVTIPAILVLSGRGIWVKVRAGVEGILTEGQGGKPIVWPMIEPATRYWRVMTNCDFMPFLAGGEVI
jgi:hypothetical protein